MAVVIKLTHKVGQLNRVYGGFVALIARLYACPIRA